MVGQEVLEISRAGSGGFQLSWVGSGRVGSDPARPVKIGAYEIPKIKNTKMSIDLKVVELTADVLEIFFIKYFEVDVYQE